MRARPLDASVGGIAPTLTITLRGELTSTDGDTLNEAYRRATEAGAVAIILDLSQVNLMNSAGISLLIGLITESRKINQRLLLVGPTPHYKKILTMMGLTRYAPVYDDLATALQAI